MALFRPASACAFKDLRHLIHRQVLRPTNLDHPIMCTWIFQHGADKTSHVLYHHKIDRIVATPKDGGLALLYDGLTDQLGPKVHESTGAEDGEAQATGAEILLCAVFDAEELQWRIGACALNGDKNEVLHASSFSCIDQVTIARVINCLGIVVAFSDERMGSRQHLLHPLAGTQKGCWITEVATHHFCPLLLQLSKVERGSGHRAYWFALRKQMLSNNAAEMATGPNDQDHVRLLSHNHRSSFKAMPC